MQNFSFLAVLKVTEKFVGGGGVGLGSKWLLCLTSTKLLLSFFELSQVTLGFDKISLVTAHL